MVPAHVIAMSIKLVDKTNFVDKAGGTCAAGAVRDGRGAGQLIDGALGMAYGLTSTTMLVAVEHGPGGGLGHRAPGQLGTTAVSGVSHWRFGNVDWRTVRWMTFQGRSAPSVARWCCRRSAATPPSWVAAILSVLGVYVLFPVPRPAPTGPGPGPAARCPRACSPPRAGRGLPGRGRGRRLGQWG